MIRPVTPPREDVPLVARAAAAAAIGALPAFSTPEEMAEAALDAAWPMARTQQRITPYEIEVTRLLIERYRCTWPEVAELLGISISRVQGIVRGRIRSENAAGRVGRNKWKPTTEGLAELLAEARKVLECQQQ